MKFWGIVIGIVAIVGIAGFVFLSNLHNGEVITASQKQKALTNLLGRAPILTPTDHTSWKVYKSKVVSFLYPAWARIDSGDNASAKKDALTVDSFHFTLLDQHMTGIVSVTRRLSVSTVSDDPGASLRLHDPSYTPVGSVTVTTAQFINTGNTERSFFVFTKGNVYALVISGGGDSDNKDIFEKVYSSLVAE